MAEDRARLLERLEARIGYRFSDRGLLETALTHSSFINENLSLHCRDNERLEFLGDAVLELMVSDMLLRKFPDHTEGQLSKLRASVVNVRPLAELARQYGLGECLLMGRGEEASGGRTKPSLLANTFESLVAALYLDGGFEKAAAFVRNLFAPLIEEGAMAVYRTTRPASGDLPDPLPGGPPLPC
jgi:ribonuclease III